MRASVSKVCQNCRATTSNAGGYCDACIDKGKVQRKHKSTDSFYGSVRWKRFRDWYARRNPLCEACKKNGHVVPMNVVDHIVEIKDGGALLSEKNVQSLCNSCHAKKTAQVKREREGGVESPPAPSVLFTYSSTGPRRQMTCSSFVFFSPNTGCRLISGEYLLDLVFRPNASAMART